MHFPGSRRYVPASTPKGWRSAAHYCASPWIDRVTFTQVTVLNVLASSAKMLVNRDVYVAGPPMMLRGVARALNIMGVGSQRVHFDSFGV